MLTSASGSIASLVPLGESAWRRLASVSTQLLPALEPHGALNSKAHRAPDSLAEPTRQAGVEMASARVIDGTVLARWAELGAAKRDEVAKKSGYDGAVHLREELDAVLGWSGLTYL
jgi:cleavage and polyadenylation specificity factor subunit 1